MRGVDVRQDQQPCASACPDWNSQSLPWWPRGEARLVGSLGEPSICVGERAIEVTKVMATRTTLLERMREATRAEEEDAAPEAGP
jgi:hypothetical protein